MLLTGAKVNHYMHRAKRERDKIRWHLNTKKYILWLWEDRGQDEELYLHEKFYASGECLTGYRAQKKDCFSHVDLIVSLWKHGRLLQKDGSLSQNKI